MSMHVFQHDEIIDRTTRERISKRYKVVTRAVNSEFNASTSDTANSLYVGSYGRRTAISTSDVDIMVILPKSEYERYDGYNRNGQSRLLQSVKNAIQSSYPRSDIRADGQVIKIAFSDGMKFEILPAFKEIDWLEKITYAYPDTNMGGNWRSTNPKSEQEAMREKNSQTNHLLTDTCRHLRYVRDNYFRSYHLSGIVIDSFVYIAMGSWEWATAGTSTSAPGCYEGVLLDYWEQTFAGYCPSPLYAPGSNDTVAMEGSNECLGKVLRYIADI